MVPFWRSKALHELSTTEWESLCDGCGKCCLHKLEDEDTGRVHLTMVACELLDVASCRCRDYASRHRFVPDCIRIRPDNVASLMLPASCAYRLVAEGRDLPAWHPLVSGDPDAVHRANASVQGWAVSARDVEEDDLEDYVIASEEP